MTWTDIPELEEPTFSFIFGPRLGKSFALKKPESSIAIWLGGFRINIKSDTKGNIQFSEVLPEEGDLNSKIDSGLEKIETKEVELDTWWNGLTMSQQRINQLKYDAANLLLQGSYQFLTKLSEAGDNLSNSSLQYSLDKRLKDKWNFIVGTQIQFNKHWMIRAEIGFLSSRHQIITGLQYRFGL